MPYPCAWFVTNLGSTFFVTNFEHFFGEFSLAFGESSSGSVIHHCWRSFTVVVTQDHLFCDGAEALLEHSSSTAHLSLQNSQTRAHLLYTFCDYPCSSPVHPCPFSPFCFALPSLSLTAGCSALRLLGKNVQLEKPSFCVLIPFPLVQVLGATYAHHCLMPLKGHCSLRYLAFSCDR